MNLLSIFMMMMNYVLFLVNMSLVMWIFMRYLDMFVIIIESIKVISFLMIIIRYFNFVLFFIFVFLFIGMMLFLWFGNFLDRRKNMIYLFMLWFFNLFLISFIFICWSMFLVFYFIYM